MDEMIVSRDEWGPSSIGEQLARGLVILLGAAVMARVVADVLAPVVPVVVAALLLLVVLGVVAGRRGRW